jgi:protein SCO1/2
MSKRLPLLLAALAVLAMLATIALRWQRAAPADGPALQVVTRFPQPRVLPDFNLRQSDGTALVPGELKGHWTLVFLGFTHCPDVCPTTLAQLAQAQRQWRSLPDSVRPRVLFVSVDPERDTPDRIGEYAHGFDPDTLAATADVPALEGFAKSLSLVFAKAPAPDGAPADQYSVDHSAAIAVLDPQARMAGVIQPPLDPRAIAKDMAALTGMSR